MLLKIILITILGVNVTYAATTEFIKNGRPVGVMQDTVTPANSVPFPMAPLNVSGARVDLATEATLSALNGKFPVAVSVQSQRLLVDGSGVIQPVSFPSNPTVLQGTNPWVVSFPSSNIVNQGTSPWIISGSVNQGTSPWVVSMPQDLFVKQGTNPWMVSAAQNLPVVQATNPWIVSVPVASDVKLKDAANASITLGQKTMANSLPITLASDQGPVGISMPQYTSGAYSNTSLSGTTASTATRPVNAMGFIVQASDANTDNIRWMVGGTASTTSGMQLQPGRDSGFIPASSNVSVCAEASGTNSFDIQWIIK